MAQKDRDLVERALVGDQQAFGDLVERYERLIHGLILESIRRPDEVEDLVQDVFCKVYEQLASLREPSHFTSWVARIATNTAIEWLRRRQVRVRNECRGEQILPLPGKRPDELYEEREAAGYLWKALDSLAPENRRMVVLYFLEGCTYREIARFLGISLPTVRWRLLKIRGRLVEELGEIVSQEALQRPLVRRSAREKIVAGLPVVAFFRPDRLGWGARLWHWWRWPMFGGVGLLGLLGAVLWGGPEVGEERVSGGMAGFRARRDEVELPAMSVLWEPRRPQAGERVRFEVAGAELDGEEQGATLHFITDTARPVDRVASLRRDGDGWVGEVEIPPDAKALFFYVGAGEEEPEAFDLRWTWNPGRKRKLQRYCWSLLVHDGEGQPVRDAAFAEAEMAELKTVAGMNNPLDESSVVALREQGVEVEWEKADAGGDAIGSLPAGSRPRIAFALSGDIYQMEVDGSNPINLTPQLTSVSEPSWSPDGTCIAFTLLFDGNYEIYVLYAGEHKPVNLTNDQTSNYNSPSGSPDGQQIAFASNRDGSRGIYVMDADGEQVRRLTDDPAREIAPSWSPDGQQIAFASNRDGDYEIYVMDTSGGQVRQVTHNQVRDVSPSWSPDGRRIAFESHLDKNITGTEKGIAQIWTMDADGTNAIQLTDDPCNLQHKPAPPI